jgi:plasmid maintenance system antidote protein VapI
MVQKRGGVRLRQWLRDERRTQEWLGEQIGSHQTNVSAWIRGERQVPIEKAVKLEKLTGIEVEEWTVAADDSGVSLEAAAS